MRFIRYENVPVQALLSNPKNPRSELGDLTELTESIAQNGIYQELTVVPHGRNSTSGGWIDAYMVVIGHRRLAAAKRAGLETVPCKIVEMSDREIQTTMLTENVQRSDLTPLEEANGIQMCLDLGIPEEDIAKEAGMSKTKIRTRKILLKYDQDLVKRSFANGATIQDYLAAEKIEDEKIRKKIIENFAGTNEFKSQIESAVLQQKKNKTKEMIISRLKGYALATPKDMGSEKWTLSYIICWLFSSDLNPEGIDEDIQRLIVDGREDPEDIYYYDLDNYGVTLRCKRKKKPVVQKDPKTYEMDERKKKLETLFNDAADSRAKFVAGLKTFTPVNQHEQRKKTFLYLVESEFEYNTLDPRSGLVDKVIGKGIWGNKNKFIKYIGNMFDNRPVYAAILIEYISRESSADKYRPYNWNVEFLPRSCEELKKLYEWLGQNFDYRISETEKQLINGTHPLYTKKEADDAKQTS